MAAGTRALIQQLGKALEEEPDLGKELVRRPRPPPARGPPAPDPPGPSRHAGADLGGGCTAECGSEEHRLRAAALCFGGAPSKSSPPHARDGGSPASAPP